MQICLDLAGLWSFGAHKFEEGVVGKVDDTAIISKVLDTDVASWHHLTQHHMDDVWRG